MLFGKGDMTYCTYAGCKFKDCERHPDIIKELAQAGTNYVSISDFRGTCRRYLSSLLDTHEKKDGKNE